MFQKLLNKFNNLQPRQLMILAGVAAALMVVMVGAGMSVLLGGNKSAPPPPEDPTPPVEMVAVVVAKVNINPRTRIQENMLQMKELPVDMVPEGAIKSFDEVKDVQVQVSIFAGDVLTLQKILSEGKDEGFTGSIPPDCRAISISVNDVTGVAGFAKPGDHVDLLLVEKGKNSATTEILLQNVLLLSVNQNTTASAPMGENGVPAAAINNPSIATVALRPDDSLKLISATKIGEIYMSLRPDKPQAAYVDAMSYTIDSIDAPAPVRESERIPVPVIPSNPSVAPLPQIPSIPSAPSAPQIEIIQGDKVVQGSDAANIITPSPSAPNASNASNAPTLPVIPSNPIVTPPANN